MTNKKRIGLCLPINLYADIKYEADYLGHTLNAFVIQILWEWVKKEVKPKKEI